MKLEVGKTYVNNEGLKVRIICGDARIDPGAGDYVGFPFLGLLELRSGNEVVETYRENGECFPSLARGSIVKEYKEPVIHQGRLIWARYGSRVCCMTVPIGCDVKKGISGEILSDEIIKFEER